MCRPADELLDDLDALVRDQEEPFGSSSIYAQWRVMRAAARGGRDRAARRPGRRRAVRRLPAAVRAGRCAVTAARGSAGAGAARGAAATRDALRAVAGPERLPAAAGPPPPPRLASPYAAADAAAAAARVERRRRRPGRRRLRCAASCCARLPNEPARAAALRRPQLHGPQPRGAAAVPGPAGRRVRALAARGVPLSRRATKRVLRDALRDVVPAEVLARRDKVGFEPPEARWLATPRALTTAGEVLLDPGPAARRC